MTIGTFRQAAAWGIIIGSFGPGAKNRQKASCGRYTRTVCLGVYVDGTGHTNYTAHIIIILITTTTGVYATTQTTSQTDLKIVPV